MTTRFEVWALALTCSTLAPSVLADNFQAHNSYISINGGRATSQGTCATTVVAGAYCSEKSNIYRVGYGYHFTPTWGMEISYGNFGKAKETGTLPSTPAGVLGSGPVPYIWTWDAIGWELAGTGSLHFGDAYSLTGKLGVIRANIGSELMVSSNGFGPYHSVSHDASTKISSGIGAQYDFNRDYAVRIQYESFGTVGSVTKVKLSALSVGMLLKF